MNKKEEKNENLINSLVAFIDSKDIDEDVCKKVRVCRRGDDGDIYDCIDCIKEFFATDCIWKADNDVCVNDKSNYCADFVDEIRCGGCRYKQIKES